MSYTFGTKSIAKLNTCHPDIQKILHELIKVYDVTVLEGERTLEKQQEYFAKGMSKLDGITKRSKHQSSPSMAVDIMPYKEGTNAFSGKELDDRRFYYMMGMVNVIAKQLKDAGEITHSVRFGLDWDGDDVFSDQNFHDLPHFELTK